MQTCKRDLSSGVEKAERIKSDMSTTAVSTVTVNMNSENRNLSLLRSKSVCTEIEETASAYSFTPLESSQYEEQDQTPHFCKQRTHHPKGKSRL